MKVFRFLFASLAFGLILSPLPAAPRLEGKPEGPPVVGQARSLADLAKLAREMVSNLGGEELTKLFDEQGLTQLDKQFAGIDQKKPFGLYANLDGDVMKCQAIFLLPAKNEESFIEMVESQAGFKLVKGEQKGTYVLPAEAGVPVPVGLRFHKDYAYVAFGGLDALTDKVIVDPSRVINEKEKAPAFVSIRLQQVPTDLKKLLKSNMDDVVAQAVENSKESEFKEVTQLSNRLYSRWLKSILDEGDELNLRLDANSKSGDVSIEFSLDGVSKSNLAQSISTFQKPKNAFASISGKEDDYAQRLFLKAPLFVDEFKEIAVQLFEIGKKNSSEALTKENKKDEAALTDAMFNSLIAQAKTGSLDLGLALRGPNKEGYYTAIAGLQVKEAEKLDKAVRNAFTNMAVLQGMTKLDVGKIGAAAIHEFDTTALAQDDNNPSRKIFGKEQKGCLAIVEGKLCVAFGPDRMTLLKEVIESKAEPKPLIESVSHPKKGPELMKRLMPPEAANGAMSMGWMETGIAGLTFGVDGGDKLKVRLSYNAGFFMMVFGTARAVPAK
jgi:hypothetical protein